MYFHEDCKKMKESERKQIMDTETLNRWRQDLHRHPELALDVPWTQAYLRKQLEDTGAELIELCGHALAAWFDQGQTETLLFRADMDALPVTEQTGAPYASRTEGRMHACGHDAHMAVLLGFAHELAERSGLPWNILLVFQPGEENPGGARLICETGLLETYNVTAAFGLHVWPALEAGTVATRPGAMMAASSETDIEITGRSVHAAKYRQGKDALETAVKLVDRIYGQEAGLPPEVFRLLRFGHLQAGTIRNVVAGSARLEGTVRAFEPAIFQGLKDMILQESRQLARESGCRINVHFSDGYPAVLNSSKLTEVLLKEMPEIVRLPEPEMISEDFSFYQQRVPSVFFFLGTGTGIPLHDSRFDLEPEVLAQGVAFWSSLLDVLCRKGSGFMQEI